MGSTVYDSVIQRTVSRAKEKNNLGEHITLGELFPGSFMKQHTQFSSIEELFENGSFTLSPDDTVYTDEQDLDGHIFITTDFSSWEEMADTAAREYSTKDKGNG